MRRRILLPTGVPNRDATPKHIFLNRRRFLQTTAFGAATAPFACAQGGAAGSAGGDDIINPPFERDAITNAVRSDSFAIPAAIERRDLTPRLTAATHNNFYEFLPGRGGPVWQFTDDFKVEPWSIEITGECDAPQTLSLDDLFKIEHEQRLYHFRCVERWAMNVPWTGFPLSRLIEMAKPTSDARFVRFVSANRPQQMPGMRQAAHYPWPYFEGLRMDEAMHDLAFVATGIYGEALLKQHGAPLRLAIPWKYGYKGAKSIVKIEFVKEEPPTFWKQLQPREYGFLSNVNPNLPHPRWSQARSYWLDARDTWFPTPIFNGYDEEVGGLYPDEPRTPQLAPGSGEEAR